MSQARENYGKLLLLVERAATLPHGDSDPCVLWPFSTKNGYGQVLVDGKNRTAHSEVLRRRDGDPPDPSMEARHRCRARRCLVHTEWGTRADNEADKVRDGVSNRGERAAPARLTAFDVREVRRLRAGGMTQAQVAERFDVASTTIASIDQGRSWRWLDG